MKANRSYIVLNEELNSHDLFVKRMLRLSWALLLVASYFQLIYFPTSNNIWGLICVNLAWYLFTTIFILNKIFYLYPLSTFLILGFVTTQFYLPLVATIAEGKPLIFNFKQPIDVFLHAMLAFFVVLVAHYIYRQISVNPNQKFKPFFNKIGIFTPPREIQLWLMGFIGLASMYYIFYYLPSMNRETSGSINKLIQGFVPFSYAPFYIPFGKLYGIKNKNININTNLILKLICFTIVLFIVSIGRNSRGAFMLGFAAVGFVFFIGVLMGVFKVKIFTLKNLIISLGIWWMFTGPISDLATAMVIIRHDRSKISRTELVIKTFDTFFDKKAIESRRARDNRIRKRNKEWDEYYLDNLFLARFCNIRYSDISLNFAKKVSKFDNSVQEFSKNRFLSNFPTPILKMLGINIDKEKFISFSFGDFMHYKYGGGVLGSFFTGHFAGTGFASFGWWYLFFIGIIIFPIFILLDSLVMINYKPRGNNYTRNYKFSFCILLSLTIIFSFFTQESIVHFAGYLIRGWIQMVLLYLVFFHLTRIASKLNPKEK